MALEAWQDWSKNRSGMAAAVRRAIAATAVAAVRATTVAVARIAAIAFVIGSREHIWAVHARVFGISSFHLQPVCDGVS
jgi:hypothetical protein